MVLRLRIRDKVYLRMLVMLIAVIEITVLSVSGISFFNIRKNMLNQLYEIYVEDIKKSIKDTESTVDKIKSTSIQLRYDYYIKMLSSYREPDATQFIPALQQMTNYRRAVNDIDSIYVYNSKTIYISDESAPNSIQPLEGFTDKSIIPIIKNYWQFDTLKPIPRKVANLGSGKEMDGFSFLLYDKVPLGPKSIVIINLKNDWLKRIMQQMKQLGSTKDLILDEYGRVIAGDGNDEYLSSLGDSYVKEITAKPETSGYIIKTVNGERSLITYTKMPSLKWSFISVIPYSVVSKSISGVLVKVLLLCAAILFLGIGAAFLLSRKFYDPVEGLLNKLSEYESQKSDIFDENRQRFLTNFIRNSRQLAEPFIKKGFEEYNINLSLTDPYILFSMRVDRGPVYYEDTNDTGIIKFALVNVAKEVIQPKCSVEAVDITEDAILFVVNGQTDYGSDKQLLANEISQVQSLINNYFHVSVSAIIGAEVTSYKNLQNAYEELKEDRKNRFFYGNDSIISYEDNKNRAKIKYSYPEHKSKEIIAALTSGKSEKARAIYMDMMEELSKCNYEAFQIYSTFLFWEISQGFKSVKAQENSCAEKLEALTTELNSIESFHTFNEVVFQIFDGIAEGYKNVNSAKYENIARQVEKIIDSRFGDISLSVEGIADDVGFTASYITKIFKQHTGKTVIEYINEKRIEKAKELLTNTTDSVAAISEKCGFANITYFHRSFKKTVGITPNAYRGGTGSVNLPR